MVRSHDWPAADEERLGSLLLSDWAGRTILSLLPARERCPYCPSGAIRNCRSIRALDIYPKACGTRSCSSDSQSSMHAHITTPSRQSCTLRGPIACNYALRILECPHRGQAGWRELHGLVREVPG